MGPRPEDDGPAAKPRKPTLKDVAIAASVSRQTAWKVLGGKGAARPRTSQAVWEAARRIGYDPVLRLSSATHPDAHLIAVVVCDLAGPFESGLCAGIAQRLSEAGFATIVASVGEDARFLDETVEALIAIRPALGGTIIMPPASAGTTDALRGLQLSGIPILAVDRPVPELALPVVRVDNRQATHDAVLHLIKDHNCSRVSFIGNEDSGIHTAVERRVGYEEAMGLYQLPDEPTCRVFTDFQQAITSDLHSGFEPLRELCVRLAESREVSGVFCSNVAIGTLFLRMARSFGLRIGSDVRLAVYDDVIWWDMVEPSITAVDQSPYALGRLSAESILDIVCGKSIVRVQVVPTELRRRQSCGCRP